MVKTIERHGIPVVQMCNLIPVATTVGANRMVPTISIPYPLGDPEQPVEPVVLRADLLQRPHGYPSFLRLSYHMARQNSIFTFPAGAVILMIEMKRRICDVFTAVS